MHSIYERIGGENAIMATVDIFYKKLLDDPITAPFFNDINMTAQASKQVAFMGCAFDGPQEYKGRDLLAAHADLALADTHFDAVADHLRESLNELDVEENLIEEVMVVLENTRKEIVR
jgi:hemoglobin